MDSSAFRQPEPRPLLRQPAGGSLGWAERGTGPRQYRNTLVFLAADARRLEELESAVRQHLAWKLILAERRELNLDAYSETQAKTKTEESDSTVDRRIRETYTWLLVPGQQEPTAEVTCTTTSPTPSSAPSPKHEAAERIRERFLAS